MSTGFKVFGSGMYDRSKGLPVLENNLMIYWKYGKYGNYE
jgi:hypothetical protein